MPASLRVPRRRGSGGRPNLSARARLEELRREQGAQPEAQRALPAPPRQLALPAPGPGLPPQASKPRGGQFFTEKADPSSSPEAVARRQAEELAPRFLSNEDLLAQLDTNADVPFPPETQAAQDWLARSLAKYYKTDFGAPEDPLRDLAARGLHYDVDMTPERWKNMVDSYLAPMSLQQILFQPNRAGGMPGAGSDVRGATLAAMPWLAKQPATDNIYGVVGGLNLSHFADELANALNPTASGLPADLALRPESLARMSFPQAAERVGRINQFRAKQMDEAVQASANNPAVQTFKEYPEAGYRWVELRQPEFTPDTLPESFSLRVRDNDQGGKSYAIVDEFNRGQEVSVGTSPEDAIQRAKRRLMADDPRLQDALRFEGDTMGHCVGGYCDDVASGRSRIFSLRDAKGQPHVTIETAPGRVPRDPPPDIEADIAAKAEVLAEEISKSGPLSKQGAFERTYSRLVSEWRAQQQRPPQDIIQIKGKQNRAPVEDYLPFVQDFVKSGTWGDVGDLRNTGLVRLPDGRFITQQQAEEAVGAIPETTTMRRAYGSDERVPTRQVYDPSSLDYMDPEEWAGISQYFEGFAIGGRVDADRCFSRSPFGVRR